MFGRKERQLRVVCKVRGKEVEEREEKPETVPSKKVDISIESEKLDELV